MKSFVDNQILQQIILGGVWQDPSVKPEPFWKGSSEGARARVREEAPYQT